MSETGVGKSTFINVFPNDNTYATLEDAEDNEKINLIPSSSTVTNGNHITVVISYLFSSLSYICIGFLFWACLWSMIGDDVLPPNGSIFALFFIFITAYLFGEVASILHLPPLLGMLIAGFLFNNLLNLNLNPKVSSILRTLALTIILLHAGLSLDPNVLKKLSTVCLRLSFTPCIAEAITIAIATYFLLNFPLSWGLLLGFVLASVSPAVVVPGMLSLQEKRLGINKGIPTLVIASASADNVLSITGFGVMLGIVFNTGSSLWWTIIKGPLEALIGLGFGFLAGVLLWYLPNSINNKSIQRESNNEIIKYQRLTLLTLFGIFSIFGSTSFNLGGAGALGCLTLSFVAAIRWRQTGADVPIENVLKIFWFFLQPFLFALIGAEVTLYNIKSNAIGMSLICLIIGLVIRTLVASIVSWGANLNIREKFFVGLAWLPKATVQAAVGPIALDLARNKNDQESINNATLVLTIAVLSILITAPLGAICISLGGNKLLNRDSNIETTFDNTLENKDT